MNETAARIKAEVRAEIKAQAGPKPFFRQIMGELVLSLKEIRTCKMCHRKFIYLRTKRENLNRRIETEIKDRRMRRLVYKLPINKKSEQWCPSCYAHYRGALIDQTIVQDRKMSGGGFSSLYHGGTERKQVK